MDETYIKVKGVWKYLYRAVDEAMTANGKPDKIAMDNSGANKAAIDAVNASCDVPIVVRQVEYLNNIVEQDRRAMKRVSKPMLNFKSFHAACSVLAGVERMHMIRQGQGQGQGQFAGDGVQAMSIADQFYAMTGQVCPVPAAAMLNPQTSALRSTTRQNRFISLLARGYCFSESQHDEIHKIVLYINLISS